MHPPRSRFVHFPHPTAREYICNLCMATTYMFKLNFGTSRSTEKAPVSSPLSSMPGAEQMSSEKLRVEAQSGEAHPRVTSE